MMNTNARLRERLRGMRYFGVVCMLLAFAPPAWAEDYVGQPMNYSVQQEGAGKIAIKAPCYDQEGSDSWVYDGNLYYTVEGTTTQVLLFNWWVVKDNIAKEANPAAPDWYKQPVKGKTIR